MCPKFTVLSTVKFPSRDSQVEFGLPEDIWDCVEILLLVRVDGCRLLLASNGQRLQVPLNTMSLVPSLRGPALASLAMFYSIGILKLQIFM